MEFLNGLTDANTKGIGIKIKCMVKEFTLGLTAKVILDSTDRTKSKATEFSSSLITKFTRVNGLKASNMGLENLNRAIKYSMGFGMRENSLRKLSRKLLKR